jgi:acyl-CoA synthetase (AMP-forming)/AMP-acid ligase II
MPIGWLVERMAEARAEEAFAWRGLTIDYGWMSQNVEAWRADLGKRMVAPGLVVALEGDYSPRACALLLALIGNRNVVVPLTSSVETMKQEFMEVAEVEAVFTFDEADGWSFRRREARVEHPLLRELIDKRRPGLVLFSSGSTGRSKASLHDFEKILAKFKVRRQRFRTLTFLLLDHIGGINTLLYTLSNGGTIVSVEGRSPDEVCRAIEAHRVQLLPTSPTFLNLLLISEAYKRFDLSSLELITYGTETMPATTLRRVNEVFPHVRLQQTYGLSELGILRSKSKDSASLWVKVGGEGFETKVVDGVLWIRAESAMLGYLNAPSPFDAEGWFNTEDMVEVDGEYMRFLGRESEIINVGGEKVYPSEVESVLLQMDNVRDATVMGEENPILGNIVVARVSLFEPEDLTSLKRRMREFCRERLEKFKVPAKVELSQADQHSARFKKLRLAASG